MTEQKDSSAMVEETPSATDAQSSKQKTTRNGRHTGTVLGVLAIIIALASGTALYIHTQHLTQNQADVDQNIKQQLSALQQQALQDRQQLLQQLEAQTTALQSAHAQQEALSQQIGQLKEKVTALSGNDAHTWMLAQADFLVKLAGRKLWSDQDVTTAAALLKSADASLADMHDPSLIDVRRALTQDITNLSELDEIDYDGVILKLNQLTNSVDNLRLADNNNTDTPMDADSSELTSSLREWRQNLVKSWHKFMDDFISIRRRDTTAEPLLAPNQDVYLRENIRSRLLIAAQAIPRHQNEIYKQSIDTVSTWVRAWFAANDPATKTFLAQLDELSQQSISMDIPDSLSSQPLLDKLMQTRVRNLLAQPALSSPQNQGE